MLLTASSAWADGLSLTWVSNYGPVTQTVKAGNSITPIVFDYEGIAGFSVTGLPTGLSYQNYTNHKKIYIVGTVDKSVEPGDYDYTVTVWDDATPNPNSKSLSGTITVTAGAIETRIRVTDNEVQYVLPGRAIQPIVYTFENAISFDLTNNNNLPGDFQTAIDDVNHTYTVTGTVAADASVGWYTIRATAHGPNYNDEANATVEVISTSGTCGKTSSDNVTWAVTDEDHDGTLETLTYDGTGDMGYFVSQRWAAFGSDITTVVVGAGVTGIGGNAFAASSIKTIYCLSTTPPTLGTNAFGSCDNLTAIVVPAAAFDSYNDWGPYCSKLTRGYTVTCGTGITATSVAPIVAEGETVTLSHGEAPAGYSDFIGYSVNGTPIDGNTFTMPASDVTVSATWTPSDNVDLTANLAEGNYWTTFYCGDADYQIATENACAYTAEYDGTNQQLTLTKRGTDIPKGTAVIIVGGGNGTDATVGISLSKATGLAAYSGKNDLKGVDVRTQKSTLGTGTFYVMGKQGDDFGFFQYTAEYMPARKAYLLVSGSAPEFLGFDGEATGVHEVNEVLTPEGMSVARNNDNSWYTLSGTRLNAQPTNPGLYIHNGRKVVIK